MTDIKAIIKTDEEVEIQTVRPHGYHNVITVEPENKGKQHLCIPYNEISNIQEKEGLTTILVNIETQIIKRKATKKQGLLIFNDEDFLKDFIVLPVD